MHGHHRRLLRGLARVHARRATGPASRFNWPSNVGREILKKKKRKKEKEKEKEMAMHLSLPLVSRLGTPFLYIVVLRYGMGYTS